MPELDDVYKSSAIIDGEEREHYDEWFATASIELKQLFAELGYYPDQLVHERKTRVAVIEYSSDYCAQYARYVIDEQLSPNEYNYVFNMCETCPDIDRETLDKLINHPYNQDKLNSIGPYYAARYNLAVDAKYKGFNKELSLIEKTMSLYQLYSTNNSAWTRTLAINAISNIQFAEQSLKHTITEELFHELITNDHTGVSFNRCVELISNYNELNERN